MSYQKELKCEQKFSSTEDLKEHFLSNHDIDQASFSKNDSDIPIERKVQRHLMKTNSMKNVRVLASIKGELNCKAGR